MKCPICSHDQKSCRFAPCPLFTFRNNVYYLDWNTEPFNVTEYENFGYHWTHMFKCLPCNSMMNPLDYVKMHEDHKLQSSVVHYRQNRNKLQQSVRDLNDFQNRIVQQREVSETLKNLKMDLFIPSILFIDQGIESDDLVKRLTSEMALIRKCKNRLDGMCKNIVGDFARLETFVKTSGYESTVENVETSLRRLKVSIDETRTFGRSETMCRVKQECMNFQN